MRPASESSPAATFLSGRRIIELTDPSGEYAGRLLADLGADVLKVEPPGGAASRRIPPFWTDPAGQDHSLYFAYYNDGKQFVTLDLTDRAGRREFVNLLAGADVLLESLSPSDWEAIGLAPEVLGQQFPHLIVTSISPFGRTGPYAGYRTNDSIVCALGGLTYLNGYPDGPPLRPFGPQAYHCGGYAAAIGTLAAVAASDQIGRGQQVDVSLQEAVAFSLEFAIPDYVTEGRIATRPGTAHPSGTSWIAFSRDAPVLLSTQGDWDALVNWLEADRMAADLINPKYRDPATRRSAGDHVRAVISAWAVTLPSAELIEGGQVRRIPFAPILTLPEDLDHPHLAARKTFQFPRGADLPESARRPAPAIRRSAETASRITVTPTRQTGRDIPAAGGQPAARMIGAAHPTGPAGTPHAAEPAGEAPAAGPAGEPPPARASGTPPLARPHVAETRRSLPLHAGTAPPPDAEAGNPPEDHPMPTSPDSNVAGAGGNPPPATAAGDPSPTDIAVEVSHPSMAAITSNSVCAATPDRSSPDATGHSLSPASATPPSAARGPVCPDPPLAGVRVVDFTWVVAGPHTTRILADLGAEVIKIERPPDPGVDPGTLRGHFDLWGALNRSKSSITLDLTRPAEIDLARRIIALSDVVIENFSPRVMANLGLDYGALSAGRPDLIMLSLSGAGHTGPLRDWVTFGPVVQALAGHTALIGEPGQPFAGYGFAFADLLAGYAGALAVLAALEERRRTGRGQFIDLAQWEVALDAIGPAWLDLTVNGRAPELQGNLSPDGSGAPDGLYLCVGDDRWCAIVCRTDAEWQALVAALGHPAWATDPGLTTLAGRLAGRAGIDAHLAAWTRGRSNREVTDTLQAAGVPAGLVQDARDLVDADPQLRWRGHWQTFATPDDSGVLETLPIHLSATPARISRLAPYPGEDIEGILTDLLSLPAEDLPDLGRGRSEW